MARDATQAEPTGSDVGPGRVVTRRRLLAVGGAAAGVMVSRPAHRVRGRATPAVAPRGETVTYEIPGERVFPEGIAYDPAGGFFYVGSTDDGAIYRGDLAAGLVEPFLPPGEDDRTEVAGLKVDPDGRLVVCGRRTGRIFVYDVESGRLLARYGNGLGEGETFVSDAAITVDGVAYLTDTYAPSLYRVDLAALPTGAAAATAPVAEREAEIFLGFDGTAFAYRDGNFNANGIVASADGATLLMIHFATGQLFRIDVASREVAEVRLVGGNLLGGDGMALDGTTLYAVLQTSGALVRVELNDDLTEGDVGPRFDDPTFAYPTTLALVGDGTALVVNSQLNMAGGGIVPPLPFTVSRIQLPA